MNESIEMPLTKCFVSQNIFKDFTWLRIVLSWHTAGNYSGQ